MPTSILGIGLPASGKSDLLRQLAYERKSVYICSNDIRRDMTGADPRATINQRVWQIVYNQIRLELGRGQNVIVDTTNANRIDRQNLVEFCQKYGSQVIGVWFRTPLEECVRRNHGRLHPIPAAAIRNMSRLLDKNPPHLSEGFNEIMEVVN